MQALWNRLRILAWALFLAAIPQGSVAVDFADGRIEVHGFYEAQIRSIARDFDYSDGWDLTQWWNILNFEIEADVAPSGFGPFDLVTLFARVEVRYDCIWTRACTIFPSVDAYRIGHKRRIPGRLNDGRNTGFSSNLYVGDRRAHYDVPYASVGSAIKDDRRLRPDGSSDTMRFWQTPVGKGFFGSTSYGLDAEPAVFGNNLEPVTGAVPLSNNPPYDDPPWYIFRDLLKDNCSSEWGVRHAKGSQDGRSSGETLLLNPACKFQSIGATKDYPNPFREADYNPLLGSGGGANLPYRPAPKSAYDGKGNLQNARGLYYPNARLQQLIRDGELDRFDPLLRRAELAWNHGQSQQDQKELKELYVDLEMLDSQLWVRAGYQTIVWGKTELFRNQDQLNPSDIALASLASLEETRISLWALRAVWSFYDVGPLQDVRAEIAINYDEYQSTDFGVCGEPYTVLAVCGFSTGLLAHGYFGVGLAGAALPPDAWESWEGIEVGGRVEWRWDRFSFAVTDFYGYQDIPWVSREFTYSRNVDPYTGRPRIAETTGRCKTGRGGSCLKGEDALELHHVNQQLFATICADTLAVAPDLDPTACLANIFGSPTLTQEGGPRLVVALNMILAGDGSGTEGVILPGLGMFTDDTARQIQQHHVDGSSKVTVFLNRDSNDGPIDHPAGHPLVLADDYNSSVVFFQDLFSGSISDKLTDEQEALLGCGAFYDTSCDLDGIDLLNAEAGAFFQAFPNIQGTSNYQGDVWDTTDRGRAQPGTVGFQGEPPCTRVEGGKTFVLPGCRGPGDSGYDSSVDGTTDGLIQPFTGQQFRSELAALSWNALMGLIGFSLPPEEGPRIQDFDAENPFRKNGCSFATPAWCTNVSDFLALSGNQRNDIRAGGNGRFGRRDFVWHSGGTLVARVEKANILGFSMDFAEDVTKSNWGAEFTYTGGLPVGDNDEFDGVRDVDFYRLTISVDRPTFVNFLNANRTFFINTQWFFQYVDNYTKTTSGDGPWSIFGVLAISTGYFQDRLLASSTIVYFVDNNSLAWLPSLTYRFNESFSATFGLGVFAGRTVARTAAINSPGPVGARFGRGQEETFTEPGLSVIRERDEIFLRIRYTF
jgi:hypothetical protein